jgi:hypothetical protein
MTAIIGVLCKDGVVIGTDSSVTFAFGTFPTIEQLTEKLSIIGDHIIIAGTGQVGYGQRFCDTVQKARDNNIFKEPGLQIVRKLARLHIEDLHFTGARQGEYGAVVAFPSGGRAILCEFAIKDFQPELKPPELWYCSMGSTQPITDPFLGLIREIFWSDGPPTLQEGIFAVTWALEHAINLNAGGVKEPIRLAVLERDRKGQLGDRLLKESELYEQSQAIEAAKTNLREWRQKLQTPDQPDIETPPKR